MVGLVGGVHAVRGRAVGDGAVHFPVRLATTPFTARQLKFLENSVRFASINANLCNCLTHWTARLVFNPRTSGVDSRTLRSYTHRSVLGAGALASGWTRIIRRSDGINKPMVVYTPLAAVVSKLVVKIHFGGILRVRFENEVQYRNGEAERADVHHS